MKIENFRSERRGNRPRVTATVRWEDCGHPDRELYFETDKRFAEDLSCNPHAFLLAYVIPALHHGEERVLLDAEICPELRERLMTAMSWICHWYYGGNRKPVRIEAKIRSRVPSSHMRERTGFFFSGGVDSLATLRANRLNFPLEHPGSIKDGILAYGFDVRSEKSFEELVDSMSDLISETGITLIPIFSNLYTHYLHLDDNWRLWSFQYQGAAISTAAHLFTKRLNLVHINSSFDIPYCLLPCGSHPLLDPNFSSYDMRIHHDGITLSRLAKTRLIAGWDLGLQCIRVCNDPEPGMLNCGKCSKCVPTMLALLALGMLDQCQAFPNNDVSEELVMKMGLTDATFPFIPELIAPLAEKGYHDLARAVEYRIDSYLKGHKNYHDLIRAVEYRIDNYLKGHNNGKKGHNNGKKGWKNKIRKLDQEYLNCNLARFKRLLFQ